MSLIVPSGIVTGDKRSEDCIEYLSLVLGLGGTAKNFVSTQGLNTIRLGG